MWEYVHTWTCVCVFACLPICARWVFLSRGELIRPIVTLKQISWPATPQQQDGDYFPGCFVPVALPNPTLCQWILMCGVRVCVRVLHLCVLWGNSKTIVARMSERA